MFRPRFTQFKCPYPYGTRDGRSVYWWRRCPWNRSVSMAYLSNLKLTQRLILGLSLMGLAMTFIVITGYGLSERVVGRLNGIYNQANAKTIAGVELASAYSRDLVGLVDKLNAGSLPWDLGEG